MIEHRSTKHFLKSRSLLQQVLEDLYAAKQIQKESIPAAATEFKFIYRVTRPADIDLIRHKYLGIKTLRDDMMEEEADDNFLRNNKGLWLPVVAEQEDGVCRVSLHVSDNWAQETYNIQTICQEMVAPDQAYAWNALQEASEQYESLVLCRTSGKSYRLSIRYHNGRLKTGSLHDFMIIYGEKVELLLPNSRKRFKREDSWRGPKGRHRNKRPLFEFLGRGGQTWYAYSPD